MYLCWNYIILTLMFGIQSGKTKINIVEILYLKISALDKTIIFIDWKYRNILISCIFNGDFHLSFGSRKVALFAIP